MLINVVSGYRVVIEADQERDRAGDMDERINAVEPAHDRRMSQKNALYLRLPEDSESLFKLNQL